MRAWQQHSKSTSHSSGRNVPPAPRTAGICSGIVPGGNGTSRLACSRYVDVICGCVPRWTTRNDARLLRMPGQRLIQRAHLLPEHLRGLVSIWKDHQVNVTQFHRRTHGESLCLQQGFVHGTIQLQVVFRGARAAQRRRIASCPQTRPPDADTLAGGCVSRRTSGSGGTQRATLEFLHSGRRKSIDGHVVALCK